MGLKIIEIRKNKNGTSYQAWCSALGINQTIHHHDLDAFVERHECPTTKVRIYN